MNQRGWQVAGPGPNIPGIRGNQMARRFVLIRDEQDSINPPGIVAEGVVFDSTRVVINWTTKPYSTQVFDNLSDLLAIQKHNGVTRIQWVDATQDPITPRPHGAPKLRAAQEQLSVLLGRPQGGHTVSADQGGVLVVLGHSHR